MKVIADSNCISDTAFKLVCMNTSGSNKSPNGRACSGDSGGYGGAKNANGRSVQYGVASFVAFDNGCLEPNAYTDVAYHMEWIKQQIASN
jgi:secreted trypsin-like serine protease